MGRITTTPQEVSEEGGPLLSQAGSSASRQQEPPSVLDGLLKAAEQILDWSPFIAVQCLQGYSPTIALGCGALAAALLLVIKWFVEGNVAGSFPRTLDFGQFLVFGALYCLALLATSMDNSDYYGKLLVLWFNPLTTGGMTVIMWASVLRGRPFVYEYVEHTMPDFVFDKLISRKWFRDILLEATMFWLKIMAAMTAIVSVQPLLVTVFFEGCLEKDTSGHMETLGNVLTVGQMIILAYGITESAKAGGRQESIKTRVREVKQHGLDVAVQSALYPPVSVNVDVESSQTASLSRCQRHCIRTLSSEELDQAARILFDAMRDDEAMGWLSDSAKLSFFRANIGAISYFNQVLGCFDSEGESSAPGCVMACIPVLAESQEEINVFDTYEAWVEHGFEAGGSSPTDFDLPHDDVMELSFLKTKKEHGLTNRPYFYIAYFGASLSCKGYGYGRSLLQHVIRMSEDRQIPLVLTTTTSFNASQYMKYGFRVVDAVSERPEWVLMIREP